MLSLVTDVNRSIWINASAGSGKTTLLIKRLLSLLVKKKKNILCITFTNAAVAEMQNRLNDILGKMSVMTYSELQFFLGDYIGCNHEVDAVYAKSLVYKCNNLVKISTIHSFCFNLLQEMKLGFDSFNLDECSDASKFEEVIDDFLRNECNFPEEISSILTEKTFKKILMQLLVEFSSSYDDTTRQLNQFTDDVSNRTRLILSYFKKIMTEYKKLNVDKITYEDVIDDAVSLINHDRSSLYDVHKNIDHILLDEAQDTNLKQWFLVTKLCEEFFISDIHENTIFVVGDNKQSIYGFQGANPILFEGFYSLIKSQDINNRLVKIDVNTSYRSAPSILKVVDSVFSKNKIADYVEHTAFRSGESGYLEIWPIFNGENKHRISAKSVADIIKHWVNSNRTLPSKNRPVQPSDFAVLVAHRTSFISYLHDELQGYGIPVNLVGKIKIADNEIFQLLLSIGRFVVYQYDDLSLVDILRSSIFGMSCEEIFRIKKRDFEVSLWKHIRCIDNHITKTLIDWIDCYDTTFEIYSRILTGDTLQCLIDRYGDEFELYLDIFLDGCMKENSIYDFVQSLSKDDASLDVKENSDGVTISTVHGSKGLEYNVVFLADTGYVPKYMDTLLRNEQNIPFWYRNENIEYFEKIKSARREERYNEYLRLLYVAMTRARDELYILACGSNKGSWYEMLLNAFCEIGSKRYNEDGKDVYFYT